MQRNLERALNPLLSLLPLSLFAVAVLSDFGALISGMAAFGAIADGVLAAALLVGLVTLTALFVDYTTAPVGSLAQRVRGLASASTSGMVAGFTLAWYLRADGAAGGPVFLLEVVALLGGLVGSLVTRVLQPTAGVVESRGGVGWLTAYSRELEETAHSHR